MPAGMCRAVSAKIAGRCPHEHARASAAAEMHQPTLSTHRNRRRMGFANDVAGRWVGCLRE
eukprot:7189271-Pyramimonas_sp.AAC.1